jgi:hypothetical protein
MIDPDALPVAFETIDEQAGKKDLHFNGWRWPRTDKARELVADVVNQLQNYERHRAPRKRRRRPADQGTFETTVGAIVCNLVRAHLTAPGKSIAVSRAKAHLGRRSRYKPPSENKTLPDILDKLATPDLSFMVQRKAAPSWGGKGERSTIRAGEGLIDRIGWNGLTVSDIGRHPDEEVIILREGDAGYWEKGKWAEYEETAETTTWRREVRAINAWLDQADIEFDETAVPDETIDVYDRRLSRRFTQGSLTCGGRLYGGFWQPLKKTVRADAITIDGQSVVELDYGQMMPRMVYGLVGQLPPPGDLYTLPGTDKSNRDGIKRLMNAMLFTRKSLKRKPKDTAEALAGMKLREWVRAVEAAHPDMVSMFSRGIGHELQFTESRIMVEVLLRLMVDGVVALPIHDSIIVPRSAAARAKVVMEETFIEVVGVPALVNA